MLAWLAMEITMAAAACPVSVERRVVRGSSLAGVMADGATVEILVGEHLCRPLIRGDLAAVRLGGRPEPLVKVVRGLPGQRLEIRAELLFLDGSVVRDAQGAPYVVEQRQRDLLALYGERIPQDAYLLLGNAPDALDSRHFGLVHVRDIVGRVVAVSRESGVQRGRNGHL